MANTTLQAESASANPTFDTLYAAYRFAKAQWDMACYAPENVINGGPSDDVNSAHCNAFADALNTLLLHPVNDAKELARKIAVFKDEEIIDNWVRGPEIVAVLAEDARRVAGFE